MKYDLYVGDVSVKAVFDKLGGVEGAKRFLAGNFEVVIKNHIVNGDKPFIPDGWKVEKHTPLGGKLTRDGDNLFLNGRKIGFHLSPNQAEGEYIESNKLRKELQDNRVEILNANVLDYLREHPELIPDSWKVDEQGKTRYIFFWGTVYRGSGGRLRVRCLCWLGGEWGWSNRWLDREWDSLSPAAVLAS